jgi:DTW domain-containing protein YfiP
MRSRTPLSLEGHCIHCYLRIEHCLCSLLPELHTNTEIIIIRHVAEGRLTSNTGRLAALCLSNCRIVDYGGDTGCDEATIPVKETALLYPGTSALPAPLPKRLIVLDATFRQARRMFKRIDVLHRLPQLALGAPVVAPHRLRKPPHPDGMSTIEAIAEALALVEDARLRTPLLTSYATFVERMDRQRGRIRPDDAVSLESQRVTAP